VQQKIVCDVLQSENYDFTAAGWQGVDTGLLRRSPASAAAAAESVSQHMLRLLKHCLTNRSMTTTHQHFAPSVRTAAVCGPRLPVPFTTQYGLYGHAPHSATTLH